MTDTLSFTFPELTEEQAACAPQCRLTTLTAGKMRFRWDEINPLRDAYFARVLPEGKRLVPLELIHSRTVFCIENGACDALKTVSGFASESGLTSAPDLLLQDGTRVKATGAQGDGLVSADRAFVPVITVADCMPLWLYDPVTGVFGVLHSGWKGTGIAGKAVRFAHERYGVRPEDIRFVIGPHIEACCYNVDEERAGWFVREFGPASVPFKTDRGYALSLTEANKIVLARAGVTPEHILITGGCTCCSTNAGTSSEKGESAYPYASYRRQGPEKFAPMAAYIV